MLLFGPRCAASARIDAFSRCRRPVTQRDFGVVGRRTPVVTDPAKFVTYSGHTRLPGTVPHLSALQLP